MLELRGHLAEGRSCETRLGLFFVVDRPGREGRNPTTGQEVRVPPMRFTSLVVSKALANAVSYDHRIVGTHSHDALAAGYAGMEPEPVIPTAGEARVDVGQLFDEVVGALLGSERTTIEGLGEFVVRALADSPDSRTHLLTFRPDRALVWRL